MLLLMDKMGRIRVLWFCIRLMHGRRHVLVTMMCGDFCTLDVLAMGCIRYVGRTTQSEGPKESAGQTSNLMRNSEPEDHFVFLHTALTQTSSC
jgi:hypothetical protein